MIIIGVGAGPGMLTEEAASAVGEARLIYGSKRSIDLVREHIEPECRVMEIEDYKTLRSLPEEAIVLSTGDPMLSGLGYLNGRVIPGISSLQLACARLKVSELDVVAVSAHGRSLEPERIASELEHRKCVFLLTDDSTDMLALCQHLESRGLHRRVAALSELGYPEERIEMGSTSHPPRTPGLSCALIGEF